MNATPYAPNTEGIFRMPASDYHKAPGVGKHSLDYIHDCPAKYALYKKHGMEATDAMEMGTLCHTAVLEPHLLLDQFHVRPDTYTHVDKKGNATVKKWNGNATACSDWLDAHADKPVMSKAELNKIQNIAANCRTHPIVSALLEDGEAELSLFARCPTTGIMRKGRPDWITTDEDDQLTLVDFKFVQDATKHGFARQVADLRYYVQHAYYVDLCELLGYGVPRFLFVAVEKEPMHPESSKHRIIVHELHTLDVEMGRNQYLRDLMRFDECERSGVWPDDTDKIQVLQLPSWVRRENAI